MHTPPRLVFDGWSERNQLYPEILILGSLASMEESKKVSDRNIICQYYRTVYKAVSKIFLQSHEPQFH